MPSSENKILTQMLERLFAAMVNATAPRAKQKARFLGVDEPLTIGAFIKHSEAQPTTRKRI